MPWESPKDTPEDRGRMLQHLQGLATGGRAALGRVAAAARQLLRSRAETRRLLAEEVYRVPDVWLDEVVRVRLQELDEPDEEDGADGGQGGGLIG
jgi:hypothetical protein